MIRIKAPFRLDEYDNLPNLNTLPKEVSKWINKADALNQKLKGLNTVNGHNLIDKNSQLWGEIDLKNWLLELSYDKCWYTEVKYGADYPEVEHFRPKKAVKDEESNKISEGYYWLAFNLTNYRLSKPMPNRKKGSFFPICDETKRAITPQDCHLDERPWFLDPLSPRDHLLLSFNDNGKATMEKGTSRVNASRVQFTIKHFGLNHGLLNRRRRAVWENTRLLLYRYLNLTAHAEATGSMKAEANAENALEEILMLIKPTSEFSAVAKASLKKTGLPIAINIASSF